MIAYIYDVFAQANNRVTAKLDRMPTTHEEFLDLALIEALSDAVGPHVLPSSAVVDVEAHFIGGGWHWERWEIADLGVLVNFRIAGQLLRTKSILLQSKRLYPVEAEFVEDRGLARRGGYGSLMAAPPFLASAPRLFRFSESCRYRALQVGDDQWRAILEYETQYHIPVHYLLYHPHALPHEREIPVRLPLARLPGDSALGAQVLAAVDLRARVGGQARNHAPSFSDVAGGTAAPGLRLQEFIRDEVLACKQGYVSEDPGTDEGLNRVFNQRSGPIAAAIRFDINLPEALLQ